MSHINPEDIDEKDLKNIKDLAKKAREKTNILHLKVYTTTYRQFHEDFFHDFANNFVLLNSWISSHIHFGESYYKKIPYYPYEVTPSSMLTIMTSKIVDTLSIVKGQLSLMGEEAGTNKPTPESLWHIAHYNANRFSFTINICEDESDITQSPKTINLLIDPAALTHLRDLKSPPEYGIHHAIKNAIKISGGLNAQTAITLRVHYDEQNQATIFSVRDHSIGISYDKLRDKLTQEAQKRQAKGGITDLDRLILNPELRPHIPPVFLEYLLLERGRSYEGGTGLGLNLMHRLARLNGGYVAITDAIGDGATTSFIIPDEPAISPQDERSLKIRRFNQAAQEISLQDTNTRRLVGRFKSTNGEWVEIYEGNIEQQQQQITSNIHNTLATAA